MPLLFLFGHRHNPVCVLTPVGTGHHIAGPHSLPWSGLPGCLPHTEVPVPTPCTHISACMCPCMFPNKITLLSYPTLARLDGPSPTGPA